MTAARHAAVRPDRPPWWAPLVQWRNWPLLVKLAAVLMVPALLAVALGVVQIQGDVARANSYADMQRLVTMRGELRTLLGALQMERTMSVERLGDGVPVDASALRQQTRRVDRARTAVTSTRNHEVSLVGVAANRYRDADGLLTRLPALRAQVSSGRIASWTALKDYSTIIQGLLHLDQALFSPFSVPQLSRSAITLYDLEAVEEQIHLQHVILLQAVGRGHAMTPTLSRALEESDVRLRDGLDAFRTVATATELDDYRRTVTGAAVSRRARAVGAALAVSPGSGAQSSATTSPPISVAKWNSDSQKTGTLVDKVADDLTRTLRTTSATLQDRASDRAGVASVIVFAGLLLALAIGFGIGRHLLRSLTVLRTTALDVAEHRLPAAVLSMREGQVTDTAVDVVPVHTTEEFGQLARAFDTVHAQAVRLAAEQAGLRGDLRNTLVNLSRRSQSLVDRLLLLMEQLERREEDPDQLASLFTLDHLATRMRRNNENMMVLCGGTLVRSSHQQVALDTALRGAVSEIERYQRVLVQPGPSVDVVGYAAGDLGRLVAELLDNATAFSPPQTQVIVGSTRESDGSVLIEIQDEGIGMSESDLAAVNQRVVAETATDTPASRQLGLFVVGRLAQRHGIAVDLSSQPGRRGLRARVRVPATLVNAHAPTRTDQQRPVAAGLPVRAQGGRPDGGSTASRLPRPLAGAARGPVPAGEGAAREPGGLPWFAEAAAPGVGSAADTPVPPAPAPSSSPRPPGDREPTTDRPAPALAVRHPAGRAAQEPDKPAGLTQSGLPRRLPAARSAAREQPDGPADRTQSGLPRRLSPAPEPDGATDLTQSGLPRRLPPAREPDGATDRTQSGLPRRPPPARSAPPARGEQSPAGDGATAGLDAGRAQSFLSSYQAGLRRARPDQTQNPSATGRKKP